MLFQNYLRALIVAEFDAPNSEDSPDTGKLFAQLMRGEEAAAREIYERYAARLTSLTRSRMPSRLQARADAEDVVMSAYRSFFVRARQGTFAIEHPNELWRLLVEITLHKLYRLQAKHTAQRRDTSREELLEAGTPNHATSKMPSPEAMVILADELQFVMREMPAEWRAAIKLRLEGYELEQIAAKLQKSERTIRRWVEQLKVAMQERFPQSKPKHCATHTKPQVSNSPQPLRLETFTDKVLLFENYTLKRQIGEGATGKVFRAAVANGDSTVAIKFLKRAWLPREDMVLKFLEEAKHLAKFEHPHIIRIHGVGRTPNRGYFLAMDWHARGDLSKQIIHGPADEIVALRWIREAGEALAFIHEHGLLHCDLKPSNLLLADDGRIVVTDFGLARGNASENDTEMIAGTPAYLAPEQLNAQWGQIGPPTDVYGLGAVLFHLLVGQPLRVGRIADVLESVASGEIISIPPTVPESLREVLSRCLLPRPQDRFTSVREFMNSLPAA